MLKEQKNGVILVGEMVEGSKCCHCGDSLLYGVQYDKNDYCLHCFRELLNDPISGEQVIEKSLQHFVDSPYQLNHVISRIVGSKRRFV